ncbi:hypothetical protein L9F63_026298, partial [Diploptera punctata]
SCLQKRSPIYAARNDYIIIDFAFTVQEFSRIKFFNKSQKLLGLNTDIFVFVSARSFSRTTIMMLRIKFPVDCTMQLEYNLFALILYNGKNINALL